jgi:hypothetical protein
MSDAPTTSRRRAAAIPLRDAARWMITFAGFPIGSILARALVGPVDGPWPALIGGLVNGVVLGALQAWALGPRRPSAVAWTLATGAGLAVGLLLGAGAVGYATDAGSLVVQGAICGVMVGLGQAAVLVGRVGPASAVWPLLLGAAWALGWAITNAAGVDVEEQFTVFGSSGAIVVTGLTLVLPIALHRARQENPS